MPAGRHAAFFDVDDTLISTTSPFSFLIWCRIGPVWVPGGGLTVTPAPNREVLLSPMQVLVVLWTGACVGLSVVRTVTLTVTSSP